MAVTRHQWSTAGKIAGWNERILLQCYLGDTPKYHTVQIGIDMVGKFYSIGNPTPPPATIPPHRWPLQARADIVWNTSGNRIKRTISAINGASISGIAEAVAVTIYPYPDPNPQFNPPIAIPTWTSNSTFEGSILVGPGTRPAVPNYATLQDNFISVASKSNWAVGIPADVGAISALIQVWSVAGSFPTIDAEAAMYNSFKPVFMPDRSWNPLTYPLWVPVFPGDDSIMLYNHDTNNTGNSLEYSVIWGIEG